MSQSISRIDGKMTVQSRNTAIIVMHDRDDHRIVMVLTVAGMVAGVAEIDTAESVEISYSGFFEGMDRLGAGTWDV